MYLKQSYRDTDGSRSHHLFALVVAAASAAAIALLGDIFNQDCLPERRKEVFCCFFAFFLQEDKHEECPAATWYGLRSDPESVTESHLLREENLQQMEEQSLKWPSAGFWFYFV